MTNIEGLLKSLTNLFPNQRVDFDGIDYVRVEWVRPDDLAHKRTHYELMRIVARKHGAEWDGWDEDGYPCFKVSVRTAPPQ